MSQPKFIHDDVVRLANDGPVGTVKEIHRVNGENVYTLELGPDTHEKIEAREADLTLVKIANDEETGFAIRYVT
jgi:hypothetical protein